MLRNTDCSQEEDDQVRYPKIGRGGVSEVAAHSASIANQREVAKAQLDEPEVLDSDDTFAELTLMEETMATCSPMAMVTRSCTKDEMYMEDAIEARRDEAIKSFTHFPRSNRRLNGRTRSRAARTTGAPHRSATSPCSRSLSTSN